MAVTTSTSALEQLSTWLSHTAVSAHLQKCEWTIPAIQTVHILSIAAAISSAFLLDLRFLGLFAPGRPTYVIARRLQPWGTVALVSLAVSGGLLIVAEPSRSLTNVVFAVKLLILTAALLGNWVLKRGLRVDLHFWDREPARKLSKIIAIISLLLWSGVVLAGRLIAYVGA